jgi:hypothetical protein
MDPPPALEYGPKLQMGVKGAVTRNVTCDDSLRRAEQEHGTFNNRTTLGSIR